MQFNYHLKIILYFSILLLFSCKKKDKINHETFRGTVVNTASGLPLKNYPVYFVTYGDASKKYSTSITTRTDNNGAFIFENVEVNQSIDYSYELRVKRSETEGYSSQPSVSTINIGKNNTSNPNYQLKTLPWVYSFAVKLDQATSIIYPDSISIDIKHELWDTNDPFNYLFQTIITSRELRNGYKSYLGSQKAMGLWRMNILKIKNGITTNTLDSVFLDFETQTTYTLSF
jgi:hypothetical protein